MSHVRMLNDYLMQGKPFNNFVNDVKDGIIPIDLPKSRLDNIFRTNIQGAYNAGRYAAQQNPSVASSNG
jgi:hypothetical protein